MTTINLNQAVADLAQPWQPTTVAQYNGNDVMVAHGSGAYDWHVHENSDDLFLVLQGVAHRPVASDDAYFVLIERNGIHSEKV